MENIKSKPLSITFRINEIKLLHFETTQRVNEIHSPLSTDCYEFRIDLKTESSELNKTFSNLLKITLFEKQSDDIKVELAKLQTLIVFEINNFNEIIKKQNNKIQVPNQLISLTAGISISTARGMLVLNLKDTNISNAVIPIIKPQLFVPKKKKK